MVTGGNAVCLSGYQTPQNPPITHFPVWTGWEGVEIRIFLISLERPYFID